jgi:hypothetical protein
MTRPILTWALLWTGIATAVAAGIVAAALLLSALDVRASSPTGPDAALLPRRVADDAGGVSVHPSPPATVAAPRSGPLLLVAGPPTGPGNARDAVSLTLRAGIRTGAPHEDSRALPISGRDRQVGKLGGAP